MDNNLEISQTIEGDSCKFFAKGRIDANTAEILETELNNVMKDGVKSIIINMLQVDYLSSIGIRVILQTYKKTSESGVVFKIESPSHIVKNVLGMVALEEMLVKN